MAPAPPPPMSRMPSATYEVLHDDGSVLVVSKAPGVLTVGHPGTRERCLLDDLRRDGHRVAPVHRLDRDTSGVLLLCLDPALRSRFEEAFRQRDVEKHYLALVHGTPPSRKGVVDVPILDLGASSKVDRRGRRAVTRFEVLEQFAAGASLVRLVMETGRHNQIRVHMAHLGNPLLGDEKFGRRRIAGARAGSTAAPRCMLHAERLALTHPASGARLDVSCAAPADFQALLAGLEGGPHSRERSRR